MKPGTKLLIFILPFHVVALIVAYFFLRQNPRIFIAAEIFILISLFIAWQQYLNFMKPLKLLMHSIAAIKNQDFTVKLAPVTQYEMNELILIYNQMIDKLRKERIIQEQQHFFLKQLISTSPTGIIILDFDDNISAINPSAEKILGLRESDLTVASEFVLSHPILNQIRSLKSGESTTLTYEGVNTLKMQKSHFIDRGFTRHFVMLEELTREIVAAEKKVYGKIIRMMAHEVNNTIGPVNSIINSACGYQELWKDEKSSQIKEALQIALERNNNLNMFMRNFTEVERLPKANKVNIDLYKLIKSAVNFSQLMVREKEIQFEYHFEDDPFFISADEYQIEQVMINIIKNSIESIDKNGMISFTTNRPSKILMVTDNGKGIPEDHANQLFSPFFSTKKEGQGIGLTLVKEILLNHGFEFSLKTTNQHNTRFTIKFT
jgi:two-component system, NtrC family, nitrogen regulation sensor histidine kinase NtrY